MKIQHPAAARIRGPVPWMAAASTGWIALLVASPILPAPIASLAYAVGGAVCHQIAERSFHTGAVQLAVCARCTGIYAGAAVTSLWLAIAPRGAYGIRQRADLGVNRARGWLLLGVVPTVVTVLFEQVGIWQTSNVERTLAGLPLGAAVAFVAGRVATLHLRSRSAANGPSDPPRS